MYVQSKWEAHFLVYQATFLIEKMRVQIKRLQLLQYEKCRMLNQFYTNFGELP